MRSRITAIVVGAAIMVGGYGVVVGGGGGSNLGNLWVDTNGGTCTRSSTAVAYVDAAACSSFMAAYTAAANSGDTICVTAGSFGAQTLTYLAAKTTPATVIEGCEATNPTVLGVEVGQSNGSTQTCCITFKDMAITGSGDVNAIFIYYGSNGASKLADRADHITFDNIDLCVGKATNGPCFEAFSTAQVTVQNSRIGPACCGKTGAGVEAGSPIGIRFGADTDNSYPINTDPTITGNTIKGITRNCTQWLTGYGSCPQTTCVDASGLCHADAIQIWGTDDLVVTKNRLYHNEINGLFLDSTAPMTNGTISNNMIGEVIGGATCFDVDGRGIFGTWNVINNTCAAVAGTDNFDVTWASTMQTNGAVWNWKGNLGAVKVNATSSGTVNCTGDAVGVFTYSYNTWSTNNGSQTGCGGNETVGDATYADVALATADTMNLILSGINGVADNKIPAATCAGFVTTDIDGTARPQNSNCDAGAYERNQ